MTPTEQCEASVVSMYGKRSYAQIARHHHVTKGVVAGIIFRHRRGIVRSGKRAPPPCGPGPKYDSLVLEVLADGRERTTNDLMAAVGATRRDTLCEALRRLERAGVIRCSERARGGLPAIWVEVDDELDVEGEIQRENAR